MGPSELSFEIFPRRNLLGLKRWHWRIRHINGEIMGQSEAYSRRIDAMQAVSTIRRYAAIADDKEVAQ